MTAKTPLLLLILDGWGVRDAAPDNAISTADTPNWDRLWATCPHALLDTSGEAVGLPDGQMGNSEVGHMNIGAGRVVYQDFTRITRAIADGSFHDNPALCKAMTAAPDTTLHLVGLLSPGGVHSHEDHLFALLAMAAERHPGPIAVHAILDGRDTPPRSAAASLERLQQAVDGIGQAHIATVGGRYFAMDRDNRWDRVRRAWDAIVERRAEQQAGSARDALESAYSRGENDEFVQPTLIDDGAAVRDGDAVIWFNFRADRARQFCRALVEPGFDGFEARRPALAAMTTMTAYLDGLPVDVAFPPARMDHLLGEELARHGLAQLRIAETEKYAHVTYFFNGGEERVFDGEQRVLIPSPDVATYDLKPEMSAPELTERLVEAIHRGTHAVIVCNVANPDMVGHSGIFDAAVAAAEAVDRLLGRVVEAIGEVDGELLVTADHGNVEQMTDPETGQPHTAHTVNPVPLVHFGRSARIDDRGSLRDIAPTMLHLLGLPVPEAMTGRPLVHPDE
ncbi:2,3-bisphosphoglycerate-independent phosphoglycerate mutase [Wenzhouxiangella sp. XN79A]|uniref:2,3-bisphosphoglycerate-independent phosphoglycerate mutase n=1 Tax=Wenzhouxiangella sp. XN79A TaxID=2724193 RepID=UPI00144AB12D|nr:2,3-bisphosphoglycerate-independent phosphoglycerate mutase [Wenzhouxiangella sp. XN79A]NKI35538.1 2,3-bisphosphoglycerate-independent phosphoglycerate mutase [Wenzhouxiangella sp. XN79A]